MPSFDTSPAYSVVIPTYNRLDTLPEVLAALAAQHDAPPFEVVVVDDGSTDGTAEWIRTWGGDVHLLRQQNRGPAAARNAGVAAARGNVVAFLGDDTVPSPGWLRAHHQRRCAPADDRRPVAVIGYTAWHPRARLTPFLRYINEYGLQFGYALIEDPDDVPFQFLYTSNLSLERSTLLAEPFDETFPYPAWEDTELSYRLKERRGLRLVYCAEARAEHDHPTDLRRFGVRQAKAGYCAVVFYRRHPELGAFLGLGPDGPPPRPPRWRHFGRELLARALQYTSFERPALWEEVLRYHYITGLQRGWREGAGLDGGERP